MGDFVVTASDDSPVPNDDFGLWLAACDERLTRVEGVIEEVGGAFGPAARPPFSTISLLYRLRTGESGWVEHSLCQARVDLRAVGGSTP